MRTSLTTFSINFNYSEKMKEKLYRTYPTNSAGWLKQKNNTTSPCPHASNTPSNIIFYNTNLGTIICVASRPASRFSFVLYIYMRANWSTLPESLLKSLSELSLVCGVFSIVSWHIFASTQDLKKHTNAHTFHSATSGQQKCIGHALVIYSTQRRSCDFACEMWVCTGLL